NAVVDESQVPVTALGQQAIYRGSLDEATEQMRDLALHVPRLVGLQAPAAGLEQHRGRPRALDLLGDAELAGHQLPGPPMLLAAEHHTGTGLEDKGALSEQACVLEHLSAAPARHQ